MAYSTPTVTGVVKVGSNDTTTISVSMTSPAWNGTVQCTGNSQWANDNVAANYLAAQFIRKGLQDGAGTYTMAAAAIS
jgi:hypothetical protein